MALFKFTEIYNSLFYDQVVKKSQCRVHVPLPLCSGIESVIR
ncbi:hypothetical protein J2Y63_005406 [Shinella sp. BE166]